MKEIYKELKKIFDEYGSICLGIVTLTLTLLGTTWLCVCGVVKIVTVLLNITYSWTTGTIIWLVLIVIWKIIKRRIEKEMKWT